VEGGDCQWRKSYFEVVRKKTIIKYNPDTHINIHTVFLKILETSKMWLIRGRNTTKTYREIALHKPGFW
jgi:transposase